MSDGRITSIKGNSVAIGDNNTIVNNSFMPNIDNLPPGAEVDIKIRIPQKQQDEQRGQQQQQQQRRRDQGPPSQATHNRPEQSSTGHQSTLGLGGEQPSCPQTKRQSIIAQETLQGTTPLQELGPRQHGEAQCQGTKGPITPVPQAPPITSQASYDGTEPCYRYPTFGPPAMPLRPAGETDVKQPLSRSQTDPKAIKAAVHALASRSYSAPVDTALGQTDSASPSLPYSMNPDQCPQQPSSSQQSPARALPKPKSGPSQPVSLLKTISGVDVSDIAVVGKYIVVSDMKEKRIFFFEIGSEKINFLELQDSPNSVTPVKGNSVLVGLLNAKKCYILDLKTRKLQPITFAREYTAVSTIDTCQIVGCNSGVIDILDLDGRVLKSYSVNGLKYPVHVSTSTKICVTDFIANTITILTVRDVKCVTEDTKQISGKPALRGVVQNGSDVFVADENGNQILRCDASGSAQVTVFLNQSETLCKPRGLCINGDTLFIAEKDGAIKRCKISNVTSTRL